MTFTIFAAYNTVTSAKVEYMSNIASILTIVILLVIFIALILLFYLIYRREKRRWLDSINRDLNRVMPSTSSIEQEDNSHWNYGMRDGEEGEEKKPTKVAQSNLKKIDQSSQYDYTPFNENGENPNNQISNQDIPYSNERLIPISTILGKHLDYDKISYIRSQETIKETQKYPNILEIKLSEETQSIVKEIRKELNRYNVKKIISDDNSTSEA